MSGLTAPPAPHSAVKSLVAPPPKFSGDKDKYETFIRGVRLYIQGNPSLDDDEKKIITVLSFLEGGYAEVWANSQTDIAFAKPKVDFGKWANFLKELEKQFAKTTKESDAITSLEALYQDKLTTDEYWLCFDALRIKSGYKEVEDYQHLQRTVMSHMNRPLVTQIFGMKLADQPKTLAEWRDQTISFDRSWRECRDIFAQQKRSATQYYSCAEPSAPPSTNTITPKKTYYENIPMDVDR
jgi:Retrotransposon gag protein